VTFTATGFPADSQVSFGGSADAESIYSSYPTLETNSAGDVTYANGMTPVVPFGQGETVTVGVHSLVTSASATGVDSFTSPTPN
jgi:hypothetical protein